jgi:hypothetical protein
MGNILAFQPKRAGGTRRPQGKSPPATIIIFPGVRYERRPDVARNVTPPNMWWPRMQPGPLQTS